MLKSKNLQCNLCVDDDIMLRCDADKIQRVFDNLLRNAVIYSFESSGGAGLGLAIAKQIVELHNGTIVAESQEDENKFSITLPLA